MANACPILTPEQSKASEILDAAKRSKIYKVHKAIAEAVKQFRKKFMTRDLNLAPAPTEYYNVVFHRRMYLAICGTNAKTFEDGDIKKAIKFIRNHQRIANRYKGLKSR